MIIRPPNDGYTPVLSKLSSHTLRDMIAEGDNHAYAEWRWRIEQRTPWRKRKHRKQ